jgi:integration host factor subunit beta
VIKSQLVFKVAGRFRRIRLREVGKAVNVIFDHVVSALAHGERVELRGFGSFSVKMRGGRVGRNPRSGATIHEPAKILAFRQSHGIRKRLNPVAPLAESSEHTGRSRHSSPRREKDGARAERDGLTPSKCLSPRPMEPKTGLAPQTQARPENFFRDCPRLELSGGD